MRRRIIAAFTVIALLAILSLGSLAYFTKTETSSNVITAGSIELKICQTPFPEEEIRVMPGDTKAMTLQAENTGEHPAYVRMEIAPDEEGIMSFNINQEYWIYEDGYYYYKEELKAGEKSEPLFTEVSFDSATLDDGYIEKKLLLDFILYGVQSENNGSEPLKAAGWPEREVK